MTFSTATYKSEIKQRISIGRIRLRSVVDSPCGLRYMIDNLGICSGFARKKLLDSLMMINEEEIKEYYSKLKEIRSKFGSESGHNVERESLLHKFCDLKDVSGTIKRLSAAGILDDIELFEIKALAMLSVAVKEILFSTGTACIAIPDMEGVITLLDPDGMRIRSFYLYDSYSEELRALRDTIKKSRLEERQELEIKEKLLECKIRGDISAKLAPYAAALQVVLETLGDLDILIAKAMQMEEHRLVFPSISIGEVTSYKGLFHPQVESFLKERARRRGDEGVFTPIDIEFGKEPVIITGANMGGKTVTLMMCALAQYLFQFGFGIPSKSCNIALKEGIALTMGDGQDITGGYSSFAAEMLSVNEIIKSAREGINLLALIDEPARTTNPIEGRALVQGMLDTLSGYRISVIVSTHYNADEGNYKRLRVIGFVDGKMDYRLVEAKKGDVPHEAIKIAGTLGVDSEWLSATEKYLKD